MKLKEGTAHPNFDNLRQARVIEVCEACSLVDDQSYVLTDEADLAQHKGHFLVNKNTEIFQPLMSSALVQILNKIQPEDVFLRLQFAWDSNVFKGCFIVQIFNLQSEAMHFFQV